MTYEGKDSSYYEVVKIKKGFVLGRAQASVDEQVIVSAKEIIIFYVLLNRISLMLPYTVS
jgi:hypothetical protein